MKHNDAQKGFSLKLSKRKKTSVYMQKCKQFQHVHVLECTNKSKGEKKTVIMVAQKETQ